MTTWMVVEDEPDLYDMVLAMYEVVGVNGVAFANGEDAVDWIEALEGGYSHHELPELALLDIRLPGDVSGVEVGSRLRASSILGNMRVVLMTAYRLNPQQEASALAQAGADLIIYKPLPPIAQFQQLLRGLTING